MIAKLVPDVVLDERGKEEEDKEEEDEEEEDEEEEDEEEEDEDEEEDGKCLFLADTSLSLSYGSKKLGNGDFPVMLDRAKLARFLCPEFVCISG